MFVFWWFVFVYFYFTDMEILVLLLCLGSSSASSPHIVFILADDLGVNDVGWRNPRIVTPNLGGFKF